MNLKNSFIVLKNNKPAQRFIAWFLIALMFFTMLPSFPVTVEAADGGSEVTRNIGDVLEENGGEAEFTLTEKGSALGPVIKSQKTLNYSLGTSAHVAEYTIDGVTGVGFCLDHTKASSSTMHVKVKSTNSLGALTKNVFYMGYSDNGRDASGTYVSGLISAANSLSVAGGKGKVMKDDEVSAFNGMSADAKNEAWRKATQLAIWMSTKAGGKANMVIEDQMYVQNGTVRSMELTDAVDVIKYEFGNNNGSAEKATLGLAKVLYLMASAGTDQGWDITEREPKIKTYPLEKDVLKLRSFYNESTGLVDFTNAGSNPGEGNIAKAFDDLAGSGVIKQTVAGKECYVIYYTTVSQTQPLGDVRAEISDESQNLPDGTFLSGLSSSDCAALGINSSNAHEDKTGTKIYWPVQETLAGASSHTDADFGITNMPITGVYDKDTHYNFPMYYKLCIPVASVDPNDTTKVAIQIVGSTSSATSYEGYQADNENSSMQPFILGDTVTTVSSGGDVVWAGATSITPPDTPGPGGTPAPASLTGVVSKVDTNGNAVSGAHFHFEGIGANTSRGDFVSDGMGVVDIQWTDPYGANYLSPGSYMVTETKAPTGYNLDSGGGKTLELYADGSCSGNLVFIDSPRPTIILHKQDDSGNPLDGVYFNMYKDGALIGEVGPTVGGEYEVGAPDGLENGYYEFEESRAPGGYIKSTERKSIFVDFDNNTYTLAARSLTFTNSKYPTIHILKQDDTGKGLGGAVFEVKIDDTTVGEFTTTEDGSLNIGYEDIKAYLDESRDSWTVSAREVTPPSDYLLNDDDWHITELRLGQDPAQLVFVDSKYPQIIIKKVDRGTNNGLDGAKFEVRIDAATIGTYTTQNGGQIVIDYATYNRFLDDLNRPDQTWTVSVREVAAPDGYLIDDVNWQEQRLTLGEILEPFVFVDTKYPDIEIYKLQRGTNTGLPGAKFEVKIDNHSIGTYTTDKDGKILIDYETYKRFLGDIDNPEKKSWTIAVRETVAPDGHLIDDDNWQEQELILGSSIAPFIFTDTEYGDILIKKLVRGTLQGLEGAVFEVKIDETKIGEYTTNKAGQILISYDEYARFLGDQTESDKDKNSWTVGVREIVPPDGYLLDDEEWHYAEYRSGEKVKPFVFTDTKYPDILIKKLDAGTKKGLEGAVFQLTVNGTMVDEFVTDKDGNIKIPYDTYGRFLGDQTNPEQIEWTIGVREITPPDGYLIDDDNWHYGQLKIGEKLETFVFTDTAYPDIKIIKVDRETGERLPNTSFRIQIDGTSFIAEKKTDANGEIVITYEEYARFLSEAGDKDRDMWTITVTELEPTQFYNKDKQQTSGDYTQTQQLKHGQSLSVFEFKDTHYRDVKVYKYDSETNWLLKGATFRLHCVAAENDDPGNISDRELTTDEKGYVIFENIPNGTYELTEISAPFGYDNNTEKKTVVVTSYADRVIEFDFKNAPKSGLLIRKIDSVTKQPIANVRFKITPLAPLNVAPWEAVTDDNGLIVKENLPAGTYRIEEISTVDGYVLNDTPQLVAIDNQHDAYTVTFENNQKNMLNVLKLDAITGLPLPGAIFEVSTAGGTHVANIITGAFGYASLPNLKPGSYVVKEVKAPEGHIIDPTIKTFEITDDDSGQVITLIFNNSPYTDLYIRKYDAFTNIGLEGAHFKVWKDNTLIADDVTSDEGGFIHIGEQTAGMFQVQEIIAPKGYTLDSTTRTIYLKDGETGTLEIPNNKPGGLAVHKTDVKTGESLAGVTFELRTIDGELIGSKVTGKDGYARWENLEPGWYVLKETDAPEGYVVSGKSMNVEVKEFESTEIEWKDDQEASLTVVKRDKDSEVPLKGAIFEIRTMSGDVVEEITTGANGVATTGLLAAGWYRIVEVKAPDGYILNDTEQMVEVKLNTPVSVDFFNVKQNGITIHKVDAVTKDPLAGAVFDVLTASGKLVDSYTTDASGVITTKALDPGVYTVVETKAPEGHVLNEEKVTVEVVEGETSVITVENYPKTIIQIYKTNSVTSEPLQGAEFSISRYNGAMVGLVTTDKTGWANSLALEPGEYVVQETKAPAGYTLDKTEHKVTVIDGENSILRLTNAPETVLNIVKKDIVTHKALSGAVFELRYDTGHGDCTFIGTYTTDERGIAITEPLVPGFYMIKEITAPDGYMIPAENEWRYCVKAGEYNELVVEDQELATLVVRKIDSKTGKPIAGAVFKVENADRMDLVGTKETDANGEAIFTGLTEGAYIVTETQAPTGYQISSCPQTIQVEYGKKNYCDFKDNENGSLVITLQDKNTGDYLMGGHFTVTNEKNQLVVFDGSTDTTGTIVVGNLPAGWYTVTQTFPPDKYSMVDVTQKVEILVGQQQTVYFKDVTAGIVIEKIDAQHPAILLEGARFQLVRNTDGVVIGEYITGKDGLALVDGLDAGLYTVKELAAPLGYALDAEPQIVEVKEGTTAHATFADTALSSITITVTDENTNQPIPGAVVEVWQQNGVLVNTYTADMTGVIQTDKIPAGNYVLKVVSVPAGYTVGTTEATVTLENGVETTYNFKVSAKGTLKIMSVNNAEQAIAGMRVLVTTMDGSKVGEYTTNTDGSVIVNDLTPGWYVVKEITAPNGYTVSATAEQNVEIKAGGDAVVTFRHAQIYGLQIVTTCQQTSAKIAGAVYEVNKLDGTRVGTYTSNVAGLVFIELEPGWYTVKPISAPSGYMIPDSAPRNVEVKADGLTTTEFILQQASAIRVKIVDGSTGNGIYGVRLQLKNSGNSIQEFYSNNEGYVNIDQSILNGSYTLEMISAPDGYIVDTVPKSISALLGQTTEITWALYSNAGQIQVVVTSSDNNATLNKPAGSPLQGAVFEIMNADTYQVVGKMISDNSGVAASSGLPIGRYIVSQVGAPAYYAVSSQKVEVRIKINNDVVRTEFTNASVNLSSNIQISANKTIKAGSNMRVDIPTVKNGSDVTLDNFYVHIKVPTDAARISTFNTGSWNMPVFYKVSYKTNMNDYRVLANNLSSMDTHEYGVSTQSLGLQSGEYVTDIRMEFGSVPAGFALNKKICYLEYVLSTVMNGHKLISRVEMGGQYNTVNVSTTHIDNNFPYSTSGSTVIQAGGNAGAIGGTGTAAVSGNSGQWTTSNHQTTTLVTNGSSLPKMGY